MTKCKHNKSAGGRFYKQRGNYEEQQCNIHNPEQHSHSCQIQEEVLTKIEKQNYSQMHQLISLMLQHIRVLRLILHSKAAIYKRVYKRNLQTGSPTDFFFNKMQHCTVTLFQSPTVGLEKHHTVLVPDSVVLLIKHTATSAETGGGDGEGRETLKRRSNPCYLPERYYRSPILTCIKLERVSLFHVISSIFPWFPVG